MHKTCLVNVITVNFISKKVHLPKLGQASESGTKECSISGSYSGSFAASVIVSHELMKDISVKI